MIDLNDAPALLGARLRYDLDAIVSRLRATAQSWVPRHFPNGRRVGDEWRLANIHGDPPRKNGSCVIALAGEHAGDWIEFDNGAGGGPLSTLEYATGLTGRELYAYAVDLVGLDAGGAPSPPNKVRSSASPKDPTREIEFILSKAGPIAGTAAERYLASRALTVSRCADLLFHPDLTHWETRRGYPGLVAVVRDCAGNRVAFHRTYLADDGSAKAPVKNHRKMLGSVAGGAVRLGDLTEAGLLGLAEGIETALSVMTACPQLPVWATLSTRGLEQVVLPAEARKVVILADHDASGPGQRAALAAASRLQAEGRRVWLALPPKQDDDFNDLLVREGPDAVRAVVEAASEWTPAPVAAASQWQKGLLRNGEGKVLPVLASAIHALRHAPEWDGVLWHDEFATRTIARKPLPWIADTGPWCDTSWSDRDDYLVTEWLQRNGVRVPASIAGQAIETVARDRLFHPVREYLDALAWDKSPRLDNWLVQYLGAADNAYVRAVGPRWLISAVARIYRPGCKADCILILEGPQGARKSSALKVLAEPWFADRLSDLASKDAAMETRGVWVIEVAELDSMTRAEVSTIKAFMSRTHDRFRPPYGKRLVDLARQCVFAGSINPEGGYLKDATGGRRFWPIACGTVHLEALSQDRSQLWAEARERFRRGEPWWLETRELDQLAAEQQTQRYQGDAWEELIAEWLENNIQWSDHGYYERVRHSIPRNQPLHDVSVREVLEQAIGLERGRWTQSDQNRVVRCLTTMGFELYWSRRGSRREKRYRREPQSNVIALSLHSKANTTAD
jgi:predicted P-loop ATPase